MRQNPSLLVQILDGTVALMPSLVIISWAAPTIEIAIRVLSCKIHAMVIDENYLIGKQLINVKHVSYIIPLSLFIFFVYNRVTNYLFISRPEMLTLQSFHHKNLYQHFNPFSQYYASGLADCPTWFTVSLKLTFII